MQFWVESQDYQRTFKYLLGSWTTSFDQTEKYYFFGTRTLSHKFIKFDCLHFTLEYIYFPRSGIYHHQEMCIVQETQERKQPKLIHNKTSKNFKYEIVLLQGIHWTTNKKYGRKIVFFHVVLIFQECQKMVSKRLGE